MRRREFSAKVREQAWERCQGHCEICTRPLRPGDIHYDHRIPDAEGGEPTLENCQVLCSACHDTKTRKDDVPRIAKGKRIRRKHIGAKTKSGFRGWRKFNGDLVLAEVRRRKHG